MARNEEKALTLFNKWHTFKKDFHAESSNRRPLLASECNNLNEAEKWRREIIRDCTKKVSAIHNATLGEHRIRELNDEINKLMKKKHYWEIRIRELGGDAQKRLQGFDVEGQELPGAPGYYYYGAAKELPGVRELFAEKEDSDELKKQRRTRADIYKFITPDYYGYRDEDDGILLEKERLREKELCEQAAAAHQQQRSQLLEDAKRSGGVFGAKELAMLQAEDDEAEADMLKDVYADMSSSGPAVSVSETDSTMHMDHVSGGSSSNESRSAVQASDERVSHVIVPSQAEIAQLIMDQKKKSLMEQLLL